jgi:uncharacterized protein (TIGR02996 family)
MTPHEAFLEAIVADPEDTLRLVYADWLEDQGDAERAQFMRLHIELLRMPLNDPRRREYYERYRAMTVGQRYDLFPFPRSGPDGISVEFRRGFPDKVWLTVELFLRVAEDLFRKAPTIRTHCLLEAQLVVRELADSPYLARVRRLILGGRYAGAGTCDQLPGDAETAVLVASPHVRGLIGLTLHGNGLSSAGAQALANSPHLSGLRELDLGGWWDRTGFGNVNDLGDRGAEALAASPYLRQLTDLDLRMNGIGDRGVTALAASPILARLRCLDLSDNPVRAAGIRALASSPHVAALRSLRLYGTRIEAEGARALARSAPLAHLEELHIHRDHSIGVRGVEALEQRFGDRLHGGRYL